MTEQNQVKKASLVLYKGGAARVIDIDQKIEIELESGKQISVRPKDVELLHEGPIQQLRQLSENPGTGELLDACDMLAGETTTLQEFSELVYGDFTPQTAWAVYQLLADGLFIAGTPDAILVRTAADREAEQQERNRKTAEKADWQAFIQRIQKCRLLPEDAHRLKEVEAVALGQTEHSRILKELKIPITPEDAHTLLLKLNIWPLSYQPHAARIGLSPGQAYPPPTLYTQSVQGTDFVDAVSGILDYADRETRLDLTHLCTLAIDDDGSQDPDDAVSIDGDYLWVHVADVAAAVAPGSALDLQACAQGATLYLPEGAITMLPKDLTDTFALGLDVSSPALSCKLRLSPDGSIAECSVHLTKVRVSRITYAQAQEVLLFPERSVEQLTTTSLVAPITLEIMHALHAIKALTDRYHARRMAQGAIDFNLPEVRIRVDADGKVHIHTLEPMLSKNLVSDAMVMAGEAAARFAMERELPFPFSSQMPPGDTVPATTLSEMFALRNKMRPGEIKTVPDMHAGLGLEVYSRVTSPLRRYVDLLAHQQLRAALLGFEPIATEDLVHRTSIAYESMRAVARAERAANVHWKGVFLKQNPKWRGTGVIVAIHERQSVVMIPELALEVRISGLQSPQLDQELLLSVGRIDVARGEIEVRPV